MRISQEEYQRIRELKELEIETCDFGHVNILNLGWGVWGKWFCKKCEKEHVLCPSLCLPIARNIIGCELVRKRVKKGEEPPKPNRPYDMANCYLCSKQLKSASKKGVIKNRNNPNFWGVSSVYKILCLGCIGRKFYKRMVDWQRKKFREYVRRGYV